MGYGAHIQHVFEDFTSRSQDPNLRLERPGRNRYEVDQKHILEVHESFADFPLIINGSVHRMSLPFTYELQPRGVPAGM